MQVVGFGTYRQTSRKRENNGLMIPGIGTLMVAHRRAADTELFIGDDTRRASSHKARNREYGKYDASIVYLDTQHAKKVKPILNMDDIPEGTQVRELPENLGNVTIRNSLVVAYGTVNAESIQLEGGSNLEVTGELRAAKIEGYGTVTVYADQMGSGSLYVTGRLDITELHLNEKPKGSGGKLEAGEAIIAGDADIPGGITVKGLLKIGGRLKCYGPLNAGKTEINTTQARPDYSCDDGR